MTPEQQKMVDSKLYTRQLKMDSPPVRSSELVWRHDLGLVTRLVRVPDNAATGKLMCEARKRAGLTLRELARRLGQSASFISDLELGRRGWNEKRIEQWASVLGTPNSINHVNERAK